MSNEKTSGRKRAGLATLAVAALVAAGGAGAGLNALFTDTAETPTGSFQTGEVKIGDSPAGQDNTYTTTVANMAAGDTGYRLISVTNAGTIEWGKLEARITATGPLATTGIAYTGTPTQVNGSAAAGAGDTPIFLGLTSCDGGVWSQAPGVAEPTCSGTKVDVLNGAEEDVDEFSGPRKLLTSAARLTEGNTTSAVVFNKLTNAIDGVAQTNFAANQTAKPGEKLNLMLTYHLPQAAKNEYMSTSGRDVKGDVKLTFTATQRDGKIVNGTLDSQ